MTVTRRSAMVAYLQNSFGEARLLGQLLQVLGVRVVVDGKVRLHGAELVVLEGGTHALGLLCGRVGLLVTVQVLSLVLVTTWERERQEFCQENKPVRNKPTAC